MGRRLQMVVAVAVLPLLGACNSDAPAPTEGTVQLAVIAGSDHGGRPHAVSMAQEVWTTPRVYAGDADGVGEARLTINAGQGEVCWETTVSGVALPASASHIHHAPVLTQGPIVVFLSPPDAAGEAKGCATGLDRELLQHILTSPEEFYVNVHTSEFPAGAVRGQLK